MDSQKKKCSICQTEGTVQVLLDDRWEFAQTENDPAFIVENIACYACSHCGEKTVSPEMDKANHPKIVEALRKAKGFLTGDEIAKISQETGASEQEIEQVLGLGQRSFSRWKNARHCQSETNDNLLYLIRQHPNLLQELANRRGISLHGKRRGRPPKKSSA